MLKVKDMPTQSGKAKQFSRQRITDKVIRLFEKYFQINQK